MKILYSTKVTAKGGRDGKVVSEDGNFQAALAAPKALGGPGTAGATNPEQLFAAGYSACFESAIRHVARMKKISLRDLQVEGEVGLIPAGQGFALIVTLRPQFSGLAAEVAHELVATAHQVCPYSNALRNNVDVKIETQVK